MKKILLFLFVVIAVKGNAQCNMYYNCSLWTIHNKGITHDTLTEGQSLIIGITIDTLGAPIDTACKIGITLYDRYGCDNWSVFSCNAYLISSRYSYIDSIDGAGDTQHIYQLPVTIPINMCSADKWNMLQWTALPNTLDTTSIYIQSPPAGIPTIFNPGNERIKEVRYYTLTGQLYGTSTSNVAPFGGRGLPSIPLIEEKIYETGYTTRTIIDAAHL